MDALRGLTASQRSRLLVIPLEEFVQRPEGYVSRLAAFLGTPQSGRTPAALRRQRCPRHYDTGAREARFTQFRRDAGTTARHALERIVDDHAAVTRELAG
jgi:hypothetical protein